MNQEFDSKDIIYQNDQLLIFKDTEGGASLSEQLFCVLLHFTCTSMIDWRALLLYTVLFLCYCNKTIVNTTFRSSQDRHAIPRSHV